MGLTLHIFILMLLLSSCTASDSEMRLPSDAVHEIAARDRTGKNSVLYRVKAPVQWIRRDSLPDENLADTTKPLCEFIIFEEGETIRISVHNFPSESAENRIPPAAQVQRWEKQFSSFAAEGKTVKPQSFSGYSGLLFKGIGLMGEKEHMVLAWSMQLPLNHYQAFSQPSNAPQKYHAEIHADITIKAVGPVPLMEKHEEAIVSFARSFELIEEIPPVL